MLTLEEKRELCTKEVTLDGKPAYITGAKNSFAAVRFRDSGAACEWAWETVKFIVEQRNGAFKS